MDEYDENDEQEDDDDEYDEDYYDDEYDENDDEQDSDITTMTSLNGVFVAGDVHDKIYRQAVVAAADGCKAAMDANKWITTLLDKNPEIETNRGNFNGNDSCVLF